ncbi:MAG: T9SS type A sorting domain-containing protein, partial [Ignavibacteriaceae bacterium]|nr:T9SS type A sorting domain-containing protein [Ignavibacteriaceae bacterium]
MKKLLLIIFVFFCAEVFPQAQDYFPAQSGHTWHYKVTPLDSLNNGVDSLSYFRVDTFATTGVYQGLDAKIILSKSGTAGILPLMPFTDSSFVNFVGNDAKIYFNMANFGSISGLIDSLLGDSLFSGGTGFLSLLNSFEGWYSLYKFSNALNSSYEIFKFDTTVTFDSLSLPLRFEVKGKRINDSELLTDIGTFTCKKFIITVGISYLLTPPWPLPVLPIPLVSLPDTVYIAPGNWELMHIMPATVIDLSYLQLGTYSIPGLKTEIISEITSVGKNDHLPLSLSLEQNYPNPFNPSTTINFSINKSAYVSLKIYDLLGNVVAELINENKNRGSYSYNFDAAELNLSSGVYFYMLKTSDFSLSKKMVL